MKSRWPIGALLMTTLVVAGTARAQGPVGAGAPMPLPLVVPLKKLPLGSWSEYRLDDGKQKISLRVAFVARSAKTAEIETQVNGGPLQQQGIDHLVVRMSLPLEDAAEIQPVEQVVQVGATAPMVLPVGGVSQTLRKVDPAKRLGVEDVQVAAGKFARADHHREKGAIGETIDFWISKDVLPFGVVKTVSTPSGGGTPVVMELVARGGGAKPQITAKPVPFDPAVLAAAAGRGKPDGKGASAGDGASAKPPAGVPPRPVPSPHPGMPGTLPGTLPGTPPASKPAPARAK